MKKTALYDKHVALGAKMVEFAGFQMPVSYEGIQLEHKAVPVSYTHLTLPTIYSV